MDSLRHHEDGQDDVQGGFQGAIAAYLPQLNDTVAIYKRKTREAFGQCAVIACIRLLSLWAVVLSSMAGGCSVCGVQFCPCKVVFMRSPRRHHLADHGDGSPRHAQPGPGVHRPRLHQSGQS